MLLYNSKSRQLEEFTPLENNTVKLYVCGITPYDTTHLGHAFTYLSFDVLIRYLQFLGYTVNYTQNVTDIDDDILRKAKAEHRDWKELGQWWTDKFLTDWKSLNLLAPTHYVKATDSMDMIRKIVQKLLQTGIAYEAGENIYFDVTNFSAYGELSHLSSSEMIPISAERGANPDDPNKRHPLDFILWQKSKPDEPSWNFSFGSFSIQGRPGWHIECSAMIRQYLGEQIDIHGGGFDLIFPHHESEIAQSERFTDKSPFVRYWMHIGMLRCDGEKMSKSLGNLVMVSELLKRYSANAIRWLLLSHHYRSEWEFQEAELKQAAEAVEKVMSMVKTTEQPIKPTNSNHEKQFREFMETDLDTPHVLQLLQLMTDEYEKTKNSEIPTDLRNFLKVLGFTIS